jgi:phosphodiesterase/alkaline phosphatase D-like protein
MPKMHLDRRQFLKLTGAAAATTMAPAYVIARTAAASPALMSLDPVPFTLGVASGYPGENSIVLWTRVAPDPENGGGMPNETVAVAWQLATDEEFTDIVQSGTVDAEPAWAHSVHVTVTGLPSNEWFWYRFRYDGTYSRIGRTRTLPTVADDPQQLRFAIASCQSLGGRLGTYPAYGDMAEQDLDLVVHLGDYIYENGAHDGLDDYRKIHVDHKMLAELRDAHARFPFVAIWDDHEVLNNWTGDDNLITRRTNGFQAYYEHLPTPTRPAGQDWPAHHQFSWGTLASFFVLDTRQYRSNQVCDDGHLWGPWCPAADDPQRTMTGSDQENWLLNGLAGSDATWNVLAQQTIMAKFDYDVGDGVAINSDQWDGYTASRQAILDGIAQHRPGNPVVLSGDWHSHWVNDILADFDNPDSEVLATEFVGTSISSDCGWDGGVRAAWPVNPHVRYFDGRYRGYMQFDVTHDRWLATLRSVEDKTDPNSAVHTMAEYEVLAGQPGARIPGGVYATTGRKLPPTPERQYDGGFGDITMGNELVAMSIARQLNHGQLDGYTMGKPVDLVATSHIDRLDWMNLPYVAASRPTGGGAWGAGPVRSTQVEVVTSEPGLAVVKATGAAITSELGDITVETTYTVRPGESWITAESVFVNTSSEELTVWVGDVIDHDGDENNAGQRSGVAGHGTISGSGVAAYEPAGRWIGMTGDDPQTYGLIYDDANFVAYGSGLWMQSQREVTLEPGAPWVLRRRIFAASTVGQSNPWSVLEVLSRPGVFAGTGHQIPGPVSEGQPDDISMGNELVAMTIANVTADPQLGAATRGKPLDMAATGHLDQLDWISLPYVAESRPSGSGAFGDGLVDVPAGGVEVLSDGSDDEEAVVRVIGTARAANGIEVVTTYTVRSGDRWITAESTFTNLRTSLRTLWVGDVIDHDGAGQRSGVAGHGTISGSQVRELTPSGKWIGMTGDDAQTYGLVYDDANFIAYGSGLWMQSQREISLASGESRQLTRRIVATGNGGGDPWAVLNQL